jgi:proline iminopeptidase
MSWGSTLALLFAEKYPQSVQKIIVTSVFLARPYDTAWVSRESERFYPDLWEQMRTQVQNDDIYPAYRRLLFSNKPKENLKALNYLGQYEYMLGQLSPKFEIPAELVEADLKSARIAFYYEQNKYFLSDNQILTRIEKLKRLPTLIVQNRMDFCCPPQQAWELHKAMPNSKLVLNAGYGHSTQILFKLIKKEIKRFLQQEV